MKRRKIESLLMLMLNVKMLKHASYLLSQIGVMKVMIRSFLNLHQFLPWVLIFLTSGGRRVGHSVAVAWSCLVTSGEAGVGH